MFAPKLFTENLFDDWFDGFAWDRPEHKLYGKHAGREMLTDVKEHEDHYDVEIDLPGFKKDQISVQLKDGYLTVSAEKGLEENGTDKAGKIVRKERYSGMMSRTFYVGENITREEIHAKYENGVLTLTVPKKDETKEIENDHTILIE